MQRPAPFRTPRGSGKTTLARLTAGLVALCGDYLAREWRRIDRARLRIERCRVDTNYWKTFCHDRLATAADDGWHLQAQAHRAKLVGANSTPALPTRCAAA